MADRSAIEWTDATLNFIKARHRTTGRVGDHCEKVSFGCAHCYAETNNAWRGTGLPYKPGHRDDVEIFLDEEKLERPLRWRRPRRIFPLSLTDLFADFVPDWMIDRFFAVGALTQRHTYQPLTKRAARMRAYLEDPMTLPRIAMAMARVTAKGSLDEMAAGRATVLRMDGGDLWPLPNVQLGFSAETQDTFDARWSDVEPLAEAGWTILVSIEPMLGPVTLPESFLRLRNRAGVIVGGESGRNARSMHPAWPRALRDQCAPAEVPFLFKQWGEWAPSSPDTENIRSGWTPIAGKVGRLVTREELYPTAGAAFVERVGKKTAGRLLDGRTHDDQPGVDR